MIRKTYQPVSCSLYDELELAAGRQSRIKLSLESGEETEVIIRDIRTVPGEGEFLTDHNGRSIRLDEIVGLNGKDFGTIC
jgi:transcriptional antiterminator Rof (Rho-off)